MSSASNQKANWAIFIVYCIIAGYVLWQHEMWRDELQAWGLVSSAATLPDLVHNARYEGHPMLWFILVWPVAKLWTNPVAIQVLHGCLAVATAYLLVFRSPFTLFEKILILFSYYFIYEYVAISRNYQIGILLICLICVVWKNLHKNFLLVSGLLLVLFQTNIFAFLVGLGLSLGLLVEEYQAKSLWPLTGKHLIAAFFILTGIFFTSRAMPPADSGFLNEWTNEFKGETALFALAGIAHGFLPLTDFSIYHFWNQSYFPFDMTVKLILGLILLIMAVFSMPKDRVALVILCASILFIFVFTYVKPRGNLRHFGHYMIVLLAAYWIQADKRPGDQTGNVTIGYFGILVLIIQVMAGVNALYRDIRYPFSMAKNVAAYIQKNYPENVVVSGVFQDYLTAVRWYLQKPIYYLDIQEYGSHVLFSKSNWNDTLNRQADSVTYARHIGFSQLHTPSLLIMSYHSLPESGHNPYVGEKDTLRTRDGVYVFTCVKKFEGSITAEDYYLFGVSKLAKRPDMSGRLARAFRR
ncbi:hypothetical protein [Spirosoma endophyticum]|uniref:Dolichyl-phosphate-mannose-protein mannosyltransferase n=1 Tax=Spirosoma endophyticum TaxID=662367 RepID=A0A1I1FD99_9BACT|nr:hypothetical protein [Spirosoma endophyticum]SFB95050.1 hypothetical protein SAMN05216167_101165 [Spirosoma endophyticum]